MNIKLILQRDNYTCRICGDKDVPFEVHHLTPRSLNGSNDSDNLITLCICCHKFMHCNPKLVMKQRENLSNHIKDILKKKKEAGVVLGRPIGRGDTVQRSIDGYKLRWGRPCLQFNTNELTKIKDLYQSYTSIREITKSINNFREENCKVSYSTVHRVIKELKKSLESFQ